MVTRLCLTMIGVAFLLCGGIGHIPRLPGAANIPRGNLSTYTAAQWSSTYEAMAGLPVTQRVALWADLAAVDTTYTPDPLGEGPGSTPDADPLTDFVRVDCQTYIEQVYALALSHSRSEYDRVLQQIRYTDGKIDYRWRNHYTVSDWLPANAWFIRDITDETGAGVLQPMTKTISRSAFFTGKGLPQYGDIPDQTHTTNYIPRERVKEVMEKLQTGDLVIFVISTPNIIAGHVGILRNAGGVISVQHAGKDAKHVITVPFAEYVGKMPARFVGFKIARPETEKPAPTALVASVMRER